MTSQKTMGMDTAYNPKKGVSPVRQKLRQLCWRVMNITLFRYSPFFCHGFRRFLLRSFGAKIAKTATVGRLADIEAPWFLTMGERSMICNHAWVMCYAPVVIGNQSLVGEYARILTGSHLSSSTSYQGVASSVIIGENCWIASCAMLVSGGYRKLKIGDGAIIGAGSVVFRNVKPMAIMMGNPAKYIADREFIKA